MADTQPSSRKPFRAWITEKRIYTVDVLAEDAWQAKDYAEAHSDQWIEAESETVIEQVISCDRPDFRAVNES